MIFLEGWRKKHIFKIYSPLYFFMATISADVTQQMEKWADTKVKEGLYKSRSELIRELFREKMTKENYAQWSEKALSKVWKDEDNDYWKSYL